MSAVPVVIKRFWSAWRAFGRKIGRFQTRLLLSVFYFVFVLPLAVFLKLSSDPLKIKGLPTSNWTQKKCRADNFEQARRQF